MRSSVGWVCFVVCVAVVVTSGVSGNYQIVSRHDIGYRGPVLQKFATRSLSRQYDEDEENEDRRRRHYEDEKGGAEDSQEQEGREDEEDEQDVIDGVYGGENRNTEEMWAIRSFPVQRKIRSRSRASSRTDSYKPLSKQSDCSRKKEPTQLSDGISPNAQKFAKGNENYKEKSHLKEGGNSRIEFVATPIADLILKLSISLARPIGQGNVTVSHVDVPIQVANSTLEQKTPTLNATMNKIENEVKEPNTSTIALPHPIETDLPDVDDEDEHELMDKEDDHDQDHEPLKALM